MSKKKRGEGSLIKSLLKEIERLAGEKRTLTQEELYNLLEEKAPDYLSNDELYDELLNALQEKGYSILLDEDEGEELEEGIEEELIKGISSDLPRASQIFLDLDDAIISREGSAIQETLQQYLKIISKNPVLSPQEEVELIKRIKKGDKEAKEKFVRSNLALVLSIAKRYYARRGKSLRISLAELVQEGIIGLLKAIERFDLKRGTKFSTYATWWIKQHIAKYIQDNLRIGTIPASIQDMVQKYTKVRNLLLSKLGREPTLDEMIDEMYPNLLQEVLQELSKQRGIKLSENDSEVQYEYRQRRKNLKKKLSHFISLVNLKEISIDEKKYDDSAATTEDFIPDEGISPEEVTERRQAKERLLKALSEVLDEKEKKIIVERYGLLDGRPKTLEELSAIIGISRERVRQLEERALRKLKSSEIMRTLRGLL